MGFKDEMNMLAQQTNAKYAQYPEFPEYGKVNEVAINMAVDAVVNRVIKEFKKKASKGSKAVRIRKTGMFRYSYFYEVVGEIKVCIGWDSGQNRQRFDVSFLNDMSRNISFVVHAYSFQEIEIFGRKLNTCLEEEFSKVKWDYYIRFRNNGEVFRWYQSNEIFQGGIEECCYYNNINKHISELKSKLKSHWKEKGGKWKNHQDVIFQVEATHNLNIELACDRNGIVI